MTWLSTVSHKTQICQFTEICKKQMVLVCQILIEWCTGQIFSKFIFIKKQILIEWWQCYLRELNRYCSWTGICEKQMVPFLIEWWQCLNLTALDRYCPWTGFGWNFLCWSYLAFYPVFNFSPTFKTKESKMVVLWGYTGQTKKKDTKRCMHKLK